MKFLFSPIKIFFEKLEEDRIRKEEEKKENEYQDALARWDENAKVSKECYFLMKAVQEREAEKKEIQDKIEKYWFNISDEEVERIERIKKQKAEYEALPKKEKDRLAKKHKRDLIIIIICLSIVLAPWIIMGILNLFWAWI